MKRGQRIKAIFTLILLLVGSVFYAEDINKKEEKEKEESIVYFTSEISADSLLRIYKALNWTPEGRVAVKMSTGEPPASNYLRPELVKTLIQSIKGTIVECNTAYGGERSNSVDHKKVAEEHGFTAIAPFDLLDEKGEVKLPVKGTILKEDYVGEGIKKYNSCLVLSHFKGHAMAGFGGAIKNASIGFASRAGKLWIHTGGHSKRSWGGGTQKEFCFAMGDAALAVRNYFNNGKNVAYINVMNRISIDCDCNGNPAEPDIHDIGVAGSLDPVALDTACLDMCLTAKGSDSLRKRVESRGGRDTLINASNIGLGKGKYKIVDIGEEKGEEGKGK